MSVEHAEAARRHLQQHRPAMYAELMADPAAGERYLEELGGQVTDRLAVVCDQLLASSAVDPTADPQRRTAMAQAMAQELVYSELVWIGDEQTEAMVGPSGGYEGWEPGVEPLTATLDDDLE